MANKKSTRKLTWRDNPESALKPLLTPPHPESLNPGPGTVERAIAGNPESRAVIDSYAFRYPVTLVEDLNAIA